MGAVIDSVQAQESPLIIHHWALIHPFTHPFLLIHSSIYSSLSLIYHSCSPSSSHPINHSLSPIYSFTHNYLPLLSLIYSFTFTHLLIHSYPFTHSLTPIYSSLSPIYSPTLIHLLVTFIHLLINSHPSPTSFLTWAPVGTCWSPYSVTILLETLDILWEHWSLYSSFLCTMYSLIYYSISWYPWSLIFFADHIISTERSTLWAHLPLVSL